MNYKNLVIEKLLAKYEKSKGYSGDVKLKRRVLLKAGKRDLKEINFESSFEKQSLIESLDELKKEGLADYNWVKYEEGNILKEIWLNINNADKAYAAIGKTPAKELSKKILDYASGINSETLPWVNSLKKKLEENYEASGVCTKVLPKDYNTAMDILKLIDYISKDNSGYMRVISARLYNDSKHLGKNIVSPFLGIARKFGEYDEETEDEEILESLGIIKHTRMVEFCGPLILITENGKLNFENLITGAVINSNTVKSIIRADMSKIRKVLFVENKTTYEKMIDEKSTKDFDLVIYHGGFYGPVKRAFISFLVNSPENKDIKFYHWSDIDLGGFKIFARLKKELIPDLKPWNMDSKTLMENKNNWIPMEKSYRDKIKSLKSKDEFRIFHDTIELMLEYNCKIEQEVIWF